MKQASTSIRWLYLVVGVIALLFAGILYAWSILKAPLAAAFGWSAASLALDFTLTMLGLFRHAAAPSGLGPEGAVALSFRFRFPPRFFTALTRASPFWKKSSMKRSTE